ncbi:MAG TPA: hypothetical protein VMB66_01830 [Candidatus Acidoferrales bacterium]|nr:hypothetical protein [Candidatus Acidoferrales bacterium]
MSASLAFASAKREAQNKIGTATLTLGNCDATGLAGGTCYRAVVSSCAEAPGQFVAVVKINEPPDISLLQGTVFFTTGGTGAALYDYDQDFLGDSRCSGSNCGLMTVESINSANYRTVQVEFVDPEGIVSEPDGWLTGPATDGPRALACRYATVVHAVWALLLKKDTTHPVCATGNSGGGALVGYAITQYGMGNANGPGPELTLAEPTSGPPYARIDQGCAGAAAPISTVSCPAGDQISEDYGLTTATDFVDPAYPSDVCTIDINSNGTNPYKNFHHDSVLSDDDAAPNYHTVVRSLFGSDDLTEAVPLGLEWYNAITSNKSGACVAGAPHELPENFDGASQIVTDVTSLCK